jgi:hypothetical protein
MNPKRRNQIDPESLQEAVRAVLVYLWQQEQADFETAAPGERLGHIFLHLQVLESWLRQAAKRPPE